MYNEPIIPRDFKARYFKILGKENKKFLKFCKLPLKRSIRINTLKIKRKKFLGLIKNKRWNLKQIPWYKNGFWVENLDERKLGNSLEHFTGYFYVQEAASMIPPLVLDPEENETVLDLSAAPGSKTTQIAQMMNNKGCIIANDVNYERISALKNNLERVGVLNTIVTRMEGSDFSKKCKMKFDKVLLDPSCSSEGTIRKNWKALSRWNLNFIRYLSVLQKKLIISSFDLLKKDGILVYSTCTLSPEENEEVVSHLLDNRNAMVEKVKLKGLKFREGLVSFEDKGFSKEVKNCMRIYPQDNNTQGFFVAKIRRCS